MYLAVKGAQRSFAGARMDLGGVLLDVPGKAYDQAVAQLEQQAIAWLSRAWTGWMLRSATSIPSTRSIVARAPGRRFWHQREFELPSDTMLKGAMESAKLAREWLRRKFGDWQSTISKAVTSAPAGSSFSVSLPHRAATLARGRVVPEGGGRASRANTPWESGISAGYRSSCRARFQGCNSNSARGA